METSHNEIVYKTKKVEYILEKERRARRGSQPTNEMTKMAKFKLWVTSKVAIVILSCEFSSELKCAFLKDQWKKEFANRGRKCPQSCGNVENGSRDDLQIR